MELNRLKVVGVFRDGFTFEGGVRLFSEHDQDCCETHYLSTHDLTLADFEGLEFDLSGDKFFERIDGYGIALLPIVGHPVRIPGYGYNNGYYSSKLTLVLTDDKELERVYDISACQVIK